MIQEVLRRVNALPEVESAAAINYPPASGQGWGFGFTIEGDPPPASPEERPGAYIKAITPDYLRTMEIALLRGRAFTEQDRRLRAVDYRNLGSEELGSVYESLLELHPQLNADAGTFDLNVAAGSERKTTGSYYTPSSLIHNLLDSALEPKPNCEI